MREAVLAEPRERKATGMEWRKQMDTPEALMEEEERQLIRRCPIPVLPPAAGQQFPTPVL